MHGTTRILIAFCGTTLLLGCANAATTRPAATEQSALPAGHPQLPAGHPQVPGMAAQPQMPAGHPQVPGMAQQPQMPALPAGHPTMEQMQAAAATQPATFGKLSIKAHQATASASPIGADTGTIELYQGDQLLKKIPFTLGADGAAVVSDVPFGGDYQHLVKITHNGVEYAGDVDPAKPEQLVNVQVWETTEQEPAWQVKVRHMIVEPADGAIRVIEVLALENPTDRSWIGKADASGKRSTFSLELPAGIQELSLGGNFHDCCVKTDGNRITDSMAMQPGVHKYEVAYLLPVSNAATILTATAPALVKNMMVIVPQTLTVSADGLDGPQTVNMGRGDTRFYRGANIPAGKTVKLTLQNSTAPKSTAAAIGVDSSQLARVIAGAGGLFVFVVGGAFMFFKSPKNRKARSTC